jgi:DNA gyrase inhibitor GyrI
MRVSPRTGEYPEGDEIMILNMGVRTTQPAQVAYRILTPDEEEAPAVAELLGALVKQNPYRYDVFDHSMVVHYDPPETPERCRELLIPVYGPVAGIDTRELPSMRVAFLVFKGTDATMDEYYGRLRGYMEQSGLVASEEIYSVEIMYVPESVDEQDYTMEIMIPLAG